MTGVCVATSRHAAAAAASQAYQKYIDSLTIDRWWYKVRVGEWMGHWVVSLRHARLDTQRQSGSQHRPKRTPRSSRPSIVALHRSHHTRRTQRSHRTPALPHTASQTLTLDRELADYVGGEAWPDMAASARDGEGRTNVTFRTATLYQPHASEWRAGSTHRRMTRRAPTRQLRVILLPAPAPAGLIHSRLAWTASCRHLHRISRDAWNTPRPPLAHTQTGSTPCSWAAGCSRTRGRSHGPSASPSVTWVRPG